MKYLMIAAALFATLAAVSPADASGKSGNKGFQYKKEWVKSRAAGGYGNPVIAVPAAMADKIGSMVDAMTGEDTTKVGQAQTDTK